MILTDELWEVVSQSIPSPKKAPNGAGRPAYPRRLVLEGILWVLQSGARWKDLPKNFPSYQTCHSLFQEWQRLGVFEDIFQYILASKKEPGAIRIKKPKGFIDGMFVPAKKGART